MANGVALCLLLWAHSSVAVELATPQVASFQGQNLNAFVDLQQLQGPQTSLQARIGSTEDYAAMQFPRYAVVEQISVDVVDAPLGGARLNIRSSRPIVEPTLQLVVRFVDAADIQLRRFTLAIPAPLTSNYTADLQDFAPTVAEQDDAGRRTRLTQEKDTLWSVAKDSRESTSVTVQQQMLAIVRLNPDAFIAENVNGLKSGYLLRLPELFEASLLTASAALREVKRQYKSWVDEGYAQALSTAAGTNDSRRLRILDPAQRGEDSISATVPSETDQADPVERVNDVAVPEGSSRMLPAVTADGGTGATEPDSVAELGLTETTPESATPEQELVAAPTSATLSQAEETAGAAAAAERRPMPLPKPAVKADTATSRSATEEREIPVVRSAQSREEGMSPGLVGISATILLTLALILLAWRRRRSSSVAAESKAGRGAASGVGDANAVTEPTVASLDEDTEVADDDDGSEGLGSTGRKPLLVSPSGLPSMAGAASDDEDIIETRIKLAIAFIEVGDEPGARELLQEVLEEGDEEQQTAAQLLLDELDDQD